MRVDGANSLPEPTQAGILSLVARQFTDAMVILLVAAAGLSFALGQVLDGWVILAIVIVNAVLGAVQEGRADAAARSLRSLLAPEARVVRDGAERELPAAELVVGDLVLLGAGDRVPADARIVLAERLEVDESPLTGESAPLAKRSDPPTDDDAQLAERATMAFAGTTVTRGRGRGLVSATGTATEVGAIAASTSDERRRTPLEQRLDRFAGILLRACVAVCLVLAALSWAQGESLGESLLIGVSLAVAAVPEGLAAVVTITLALGMSRLAARGAIVRRLRAVETLGSTTTICTDKTGTLTTNRMRVVQLESAGDDPGHRALLEAALLASEGVTDPGEAAIATAGEAEGLKREELLAGRAVVGGEPFDSERKLMSVVVADGPRRGAFVKGAPEAVLPRLREERPDVDDLAKAWAQDGVRVMMVAVAEDLEDGADPERDLTPVGLLGFVDPARESARPSVELARQAGIRTVMITGDHPQTALAVARACGIGSPHGEPRVVLGPELDSMSDDELSFRVEEVDVYARVVPAHKLRIVAAMQANGEVVAMTGDGVNDVPALAASDVGVAMGDGGTDAAIDAADIVLSDNDFSTIVAAIEGGRTIYRNILRFLGFLLPANAGEVLAFALAIVPGLGAPLTILQILLVNLLTDGLPAVALGVDPPDEDTMRKPPRPRSQGLLDPIWRRVLAVGAGIGVLVFAAFLIGHAESGAQGQTMAFATLVIAKLTWVYSIRTDDWFFRGARNRALDAAVLLSAAIALAVLVVPALQEPFGVAPLGAGAIAVCLSLGLVPLLATEAHKAMRRRGSRRRPVATSAS